MENSKRCKMLKTRQQLLDLIEESKWDLIGERFYEASQKIDKIKTIADQLMVELLMNMVEACPDSESHS